MRSTRPRTSNFENPCLTIVSRTNYNDPANANPRPTEHSIHTAFIGKPGLCPPTALLVQLEAKWKSLFESLNRPHRPERIIFYPSESLQSLSKAHPTADLLYKFLKTDSRLVKSILENSGLRPTDSHDWNVMWMGLWGLDTGFLLKHVSYSTTWFSRGWRVIYDHL